MTRSTTMSHYSTWMSASMAEAARLRHREIEPEHLLLGLIAQGGIAARLLGSHGVTLARARAAVDELADADLATVGIHLPDGLRPAPLSPADLHTGTDHGRLRLSSGSEALVERGSGPTTTSLEALRALTSGNGPASRLLQHLEVDLTDLRLELETAGAQGAAPADPHGGRPRTTQDYAAYGLDRVLCAERFVSAPPSELAALLGDPESLRLWAVSGQDVVEQRDDGIVERQTSRRGTVLMRWRLEDRQEGRVVWSCTMASGRYDGTTGFVRDIRLVAAPGGTLVHLSLAHRTFGRLGPVAYRLSWRWTRLGLEHALISIARAVAGS